MTESITSVDRVDVRNVSRRDSPNGRALVLLVPDGPGVRNFVLGPFLGVATRQACVSVLHAIPPEAFHRVVPKDSMRGATWHQMRRERDTTVEALLRNGLAYAHLRRMNTPLTRHLLRQPPQTNSVRGLMLVTSARFLGSLGRSANGIRTLERAYRWMAARNGDVATYRALLGELRPDVLFCSNQRPARVVAPVLAARGLGIPTATFIFSWDNLSSKGRIAAPFDHFLVWSELMVEELTRFYPEVSRDRVHVVGTPQFDVYGDARMLWSREEFFRRVGADPRRPLICYSGGDAGNVPADPAYLSALLELIRVGQIRRRPQVVLRPSPVDDGKRYDEVRTRYPELLYAPPAWVHPENGRWADVMPCTEDVQFLANLTQHCDLNVNFGSTMTLDFAIRDKPVVNVAFDPSGPRPSGITAWEGYQLYEHYRPVLAFGAARIARSPDELATHVNEYLANPELDRMGRQRLVELEVGAPIGEASDRIVTVLDQIARGDRARKAARS